MDTSTMQTFQSASLVRVLKGYDYCIEKSLARKEIQKARQKYSHDTYTQLSPKDGTTSGLAPNVVC